MSDHTAETDPGDMSESSPAEVGDLIEGWLDCLERSGDELLASCKRAEVLHAVRQFVPSFRGRAADGPRDAGIPASTLTAAAESLRRYLSLMPDGEPASAEARQVLLAACREMVGAAGERIPDETVGSESLASLLAQASSDIQRAASRGSVGRRVVDAARRLCNAEIAVWWDQEDSNRLRASACSGMRLPRGPRAITLPASFWKTKTQREGVVELRPHDPGHDQLLGAVGIQGGLMVRARGGGRWVGALSVHGCELDAECIDLLVSLSQQAGAAARALALGAESRTLTEVQRRTASELGFALSSALSLEELLGLLCRSAAELAQADCGLIYLAEPEAESTLRAAFDPEEVVLEADADMLRGFAEAVRAEAAGRPLVRAGLSGAGTSSSGRARTAASIGAALSIRGDPLGALILLRRDAPGFGATEREIVSSFAAQAALAIENVHLVEDMQRRLLEMADLTWVSTRITSTMEVERIAATVADAASKAIDAPRIALFLLDENRDFVPIRSGQRGLPEENKDVLPSQGHLGAEALSLGVAQTVVDAEREGREGDALVRWLGTRSLLCVPMAARQGLQGLLAVGDMNPRDFPSHVIALLSAYGNQAALALQSATLYQDLVRHLNELENLFEVSQTLASSLEYTQTLDRVLNAAAELLDAPVGTLMLSDPDTHEVIIKAARGIDPDHDFYRPLRIGEGLAGKAAQAGEALVSADIGRDGRFSDRAFAREGGLQAAIAAPLISRGRTVGVLNLYRRSQREFSERDRRLVTALANAAAVAIENARLYAETQERAQFLTAMVSEINHRVRNTLQAVAGLLHMEMEQAPPRPLRDVLRRGIARLQSVAVVHDMLQARDLQFVDVKQAARRIVQLTAQTVMPEGDIETRVTGARVTLPSQQAANIAMILSELVENAVRHGLSEAGGGRISVSLAEASDSVVLEVRDTGRGLPAGFDLDKDSGLGLKVVRGLIEEELGGSLDVESDKGVTVRARFPKRH